jgi:hypothetical protein
MRQGQYSLFNGVHNINCDRRPAPGASDLAEPNIRMRGPFYLMQKPERLPSQVPAADLILRPSRCERTHGFGRRYYLFGPTESTAPAYWLSCVSNIDMASSQIEARKRRAQDCARVRVGKLRTGAQAACRTQHRLCQAVRRLCRTVRSDAAAGRGLPAGKA